MLTNKRNSVEANKRINRVPRPRAERLRGKVKIGRSADLVTRLIYGFTDSLAIMVKKTPSFFNELSKTPFSFLFIFNYLLGRMNFKSFSFHRGSILQITSLKG